MQSLDNINFGDTRVKNYNNKTYTVLSYNVHTHTHTRLTALFPGLSRYRKVKPIWILLKQEKVSGSGISWAICKSAPCSRQITMSAPHHSFFTVRMPFLPPNQQRQSTEGKSTGKYSKTKLIKIREIPNPNNATICSFCKNKSKRIKKQQILRDNTHH